jgi:D-alanine-D-alanine ligase
MDKKRIGVVFGGRSAEHEVSVITAHQVMDALEVAGYSVLPIYICKQGDWYAGRPLHSIELYRKFSRNPEAIEGVYRVCLSPDRSVRQLVDHPQRKRPLLHRSPQLWADAFFPVVHGSFGEDGTLQGLFELADVPYVGSGVAASAIGMDKIRTKAICTSSAIPVLGCLSISRIGWRADSQAFLDTVERQYRYPVIVKPVCLGSSIGVTRCENRAQLQRALETSLLFDERALVERALTNFTEINCSVLGPPERVSVCEQPCTNGPVLSFDAKYKSGRKQAALGMKTGMASLERIVPAKISAELTGCVQALSAKLFQAIGASGVARADFLVDTDENRLYLNEINTMPGSLAFYLWEASGLPFDELVTILVKMAYDRYASRGETKFSFEANLLALPQQAAV